MNQPESGPQASASASFRWIVLAFVVSATTINYVDRQIIALLKPLLEDSFGWSDRDYGHVVSAFQFSAAMAYLGAGWFVDRIGVRWGYALAVGVWSLAGMAHAAARSVLDFVVARVALGISEAANTPVAVKSIAEWFPLRERALALGFMNSGSNLGAIITPLVVPGLALTFGWQMAFIVTGGLGFVWLLAWVAVYRTHRSRQRVAVEIAIDRAPVPWRLLLRDRRTWAVAGAKLLTDPVWWFLLFWLPDFLHRQFALDLRTFGPPLAAVYSMATVGALSGGWLPARLLRRGASLNAARKTTLLICALAVLPIPFVLVVGNYWYAVLLVGTALAAHQGFSTNVFAIATDLFPDRMVGTVVGMGALLGNFGGLAMLEFTGWMLARSGNYLPMFLICASAYLLGLLLIHVLVPRIQPHGHA